MANTTLADARTTSQGDNTAEVELPVRFSKDAVNMSKADLYNKFRKYTNIPSTDEPTGEKRSFNAIYEYRMANMNDTYSTVFNRAGRGNYYLQWLIKNTSIISYGFDPKFRLRRFAIPYLTNDGHVDFLHMFADSTIFSPCRPMTSTYTMSAFLIGDIEAIEEFAWFSENMEPSEDKSENVRMGDFKISSKGISTKEVVIPIKTLRLPKQSFYPYIEQDIYSMFDKFLNSSSNIWLLTGPKGTGKTTLLRALVAHSKRKGNFCSDTATLMHSDGLSYISDLAFDEDPQLIILEDASEKFLGHRTEGNTGMSSILNVFEGALPATGKLIISTNVTDISKMDRALTRPGRCFAVTSFGGLTLEQCNKVMTDMEREHITEEQYRASRGGDDLLTLASLLNLDVPSVNLKQKVFGFA